MRSLGSKSVGFLAAILMAATVAPALADSVTPASVSFSSDTDFTVNLPQFNPALGTLSSVQVTLNATLTPEVIVLNFGSTSEPVAFASVTSVSGTPATWTNATLGTLSNAFSYSVSGQTATGAGSLPFSLTDFVDPTPIATDLVSSSITSGLGAYTGTGTLPFTFTDEAPDVTSSGTEDLDNNLGFGGDRTLAGSASVTYTYTATPVPLPTAASVGFGMLAGLGALFAFRKRRRMNSWA